jgi:rare lipoprotein A
MKIILAISLLLVAVTPSRAAIASWYDANGLTCACWNYPLGTKLRVTEIHNGLSVIVTVNDVGPARRLVARGVKIDLSRDAFAALDGLELGHAEVRIEKMK